MTGKRFRYGFVCGDKGLVAPNGEWLIENVNSVTDLEENWDNVLEVLNAQHEEIEQLRKENEELEKFRYGVFKSLHKVTGKGDDK